MSSTRSYVRCSRILCECKRKGLATRYLKLYCDIIPFQVGSLHSQIPQAQRLNSLAQFRSKKLKVLICTDVAARGLDIPHVSPFPSLPLIPSLSLQVDVVVNHSLPQCPKTYVHRVGRSARAGRFGSALSFVTQYDVVLLQAIEKLIGKKIDQLNVSHLRIC